MCNVVVLLRAHSMNSLSKNIFKLPSENMNGGKYLKPMLLKKWPIAVFLYYTFLT